jgi:hypothetical protein
MKRSAVFALTVGITVLVAGCAGVRNDELEQAYGAGNISEADYYRLKLQRDAQRRAYFMQLQNSQQQYQKDSQDILNQAIASDHQRESAFSEQMTRSSIATQSVLGQRQPTGFFNAASQTSASQQQNLPTVWDQPKSTDWQTGNVRTGTDGRMWHEYTTTSGYKYWKVDQGIR